MTFYESGGVAFIVNIRKSHVHKRFMMLLMISMLTPAIAWIFLALLAPPGAGAVTAILP